MKKSILLPAAAILLLAASCAKEKHCRCAVLGSQAVRIITIKSANCHDINYVSYYDELDTLHVDSLVCTDYPFEADSLVEYTHHED